MGLQKETTEVKGLSRTTLKEFSTWLISNDGDLDHLDETVSSFYKIPLFPIFILKLWTQVTMHSTH